MQSVLLYLFGMCRRRCPHRPADLPEDSDFLVQPCRNRPAEFARCTRCPPGVCQRRLLPLPVSVVLIFRRFLVQAGDFYFYGVCKFAFLGSPLGHPKGVPCAELSPQVTEGLPATAANRFHKELRFFFSLLKRKKEAKKEKSSRFTCTTRSSITRRLHAAKIPQRGIQAAAAAVTLPFSHLKLGRKVSGNLPLSLLKRKKKQKKKRVRVLLVLHGNEPPEDYTSTKIPRRGIQAAAAAVTLPFSHLKLGRRVSGDPPQKENLLCIPLQQSQPHTLPAALP